MRGSLDSFVRKMLKDLRAGTYSLIMLNIIFREGPIHGYALKVKISELSNGVLKPSEGTIYESLKYLEKCGLVKSFWGEGRGGPPRKYYVVTDEGRKVLSLINVEAMKLLRVLEEIIGLNTEVIKEKSF